MEYLYNFLAVEQVAGGDDVAAAVITAGEIGANSDALFLGLAMGGRQNTVIGIGH